LTADINLTRKDNSDKIDAKNILHLIHLEQ